jgi:hypothetical protein
MNPDSSCPLMRSPRKRAAANRRTEAIQAAFPAGLAKPALRALAAAGCTRLDDLQRISESELAALHGMGPKALGLLRTAMRERGLKFARED